MLGSPEKLWCFFSVLLKAYLFRGAPVVVLKNPSRKIAGLAAAWTRWRCTRMEPQSSCTRHQGCRLHPDNTSRRYRVYVGGPLAWSGGSRGRAIALACRYRPRWVESEESVKRPLVDELDILGVRRDLLDDWTSALIIPEGVKSRRTKDEEAYTRRIQAIVAHEMAHERQQFCHSHDPKCPMTVFAAEAEAESEAREYCRDVLKHPWRRKDQIASSARLTLHWLLSPLARFGSTFVFNFVRLIVFGALAMQTYVVATDLRHGAAQAHQY